MSFTPVTKKVLTRPLLKFSTGITHHVLFQGAMFIGKEMKPGADGKKKEPATLADVVDLETGEVAQMIVNAVVKSVLTEAYPADTYVGRAFSITKQPRKEGKAYDPFNVVEIEVPADAPKPAAAAADKPANKGK